MHAYIYWSSQTSSHNFFSNNVPECPLYVLISLFVSERWWGGECHGQSGQFWGMWLNLCMNYQPDHSSESCFYRTCFRLNMFCLNMCCVHFCPAHFGHWFVCHFVPCSSRSLPLDWLSPHPRLPLHTFLSTWKLNCDICDALGRFEVGKASKFIKKPKQLILASYNLRISMCSIQFTIIYLIMIQNGGLSADFTHIKPD